MIIYRCIEQICLKESYLIQLAYRFHRGTKCNFHCDITCFHTGNIRHPLSVQPALMSVEIFTIFVLKRFFRKTDHSSLLNVIPPSNTDEYFLPNVFPSLAWKFGISFRLFSLLFTFLSSENFKGCSFRY